MYLYTYMYMYMYVRNSLILIHVHVPSLLHQEICNVQSKCLTGQQTDPCYPETMS